MRELAHANPNSIPKAHYVLEEDTTITLPLFTPSRNEEEFYRFGGAIDLDDLNNDRRVPGVSKKLLFIEPTLEGHIEYSIIGREVEVSKKLGLHLETVKERIRVLSRRDKLGRTGMYLKVQLEPESSFESTWKYLSDRDPVLRRHWKIRKK
jgi:predicted nucleotidyltransferase